MIMELANDIYQWFLALGKDYGVNPFIFGAIYVGAIPFFTISIAWLVRNYRQKKSIALPVVSSSGCFVSSYVYLMVAGENVPLWVYAVVVSLLVYGGWTTYINVKKRVKRES